jgi:hypothetical protein
VRRLGDRAQQVAGRHRLAHLAVEDETGLPRPPVDRGLHEVVGGADGVVGVLELDGGPGLAVEGEVVARRAQGVGPKLALRIITELKGKPITDGPVSAFQPTIITAEPVKVSASGDAVAALMGLGVAEVNARRVVEQAAVRLGEDAQVQALIKAGLQELGR